MPLPSNQKLLFSVLFLFTLLAAVVALTAGNVMARPGLAPNSQASPIHPAFPLLDGQGENVLQSGQAVSTMNTCGACHDTAFIAQHSYHADLGLADFSDPASVAPGNPWDASPALFGKWNPLLYRYLSPQGDSRLDLGTAAWIQEFGAWHVGGGPAEYSREGLPLVDLPASPGDAETHILDPQTGALVPWDWQESGLVEMNCFLCHTPAPDNQARIEALQAGDFRWANTATLLASGIVGQAGGEYLYNAAAFDANGQLRPEFANIQDPTNQNCGQCHGLVHTDLAEPLVATGCETDQWRTQTTGEINSPQHISASGMNLANKQDLARSWDIHAERLVQCTDCHYSLNNPVYFQGAQENRPDHLLFDPRRLELGEYLKQPLHQFARGGSTQGALAAGSNNTMRRCESCHSPEASHDWLPYKQYHFDALSCETCHIPQTYAAAFQQYDWTVITPQAGPLTECRGLEGEPGTLDALITGYTPVLLPRQGLAGESRIAPFNLITAWYWIYGDPARPVRLVDLQDAWLEGEGYHPEILAAFDQDGDGRLSEAELLLDSQEKVGLLANRLKKLGLENPRIAGEILPYNLSHTVATGRWAIRDCQTCHSAASRLAQPMQLASYLPGGVMPDVTPGASALLNGSLYQTENGFLYYRPETLASGRYILGHDSLGWVDRIGSLVFAGVLAGVAAHGSFRFFVSLRRPRSTPRLKRIYMYGVYERFWHWLQTFVILALLFTGLVIHKPDTFGLFSFRSVVLVHNIMAGILVANAALSLFYHLASGEIRQFIPPPAGFFDQAIQQSLYYLRGIFRGDQHPFEKTPAKKLNPLQQATYFAILNVLLPLQVISGALMWGAQRWPEWTARLGGLPFLAPFHTLIAWLFAAFIVMHVYLTTTGHAPLANIHAMMAGWDEIEVLAQTEEELAS